MKIALGTDHAGYAAKELVKGWLAAMGHEVLDFGTFSPASCDYPDFVRPAAEAVAKGQAERGLVFGGSGNGEAICANRVKGVRCALCWNLESAKLGRQHNDANVIAIGGRMVDEATLKAILEIFLTTPFDGGRHVARIAKLDL